MSQGLCIAFGVLYIGRHAKSAQVTAFDLDGRRLGRIAEFRDESVGRSEARGLSVDTDHRLWVADGSAGCVRGFTLFGIQIACLGGGDPHEDKEGHLGQPVGVLALGEDEEMVLVVASSGRRRHAVQVLEPNTGRTLSLRPLGDPRGRFEDVVAIAPRGEKELLVLEGSAARIQVFRGGDFHFSIPLPLEAGRPTGLAVTASGLCVVAVGEGVSGLFVVDDQGRRRATLATEGRVEGQVDQPVALAIAPALGAQQERLFVLDQMGDRVQVFNLRGNCYGAFSALVS